MLVDAGVAGGSDGVDCVRVGLGPSRDLSVEPALEVAEVALAVDAGRELAARAAADGVTVLAGGEMGIANTTPATCLAAALTGRDVAAARRAGHRARRRGRRAQARGVLSARSRCTPTPRAGRCTRCAGSAAGRSPCCAASRSAPASTASATCATGSSPRRRPPSPRASSPTCARGCSPATARPSRPTRVLLEHLGLDPVLDLGLRLGEGSGATAALAVLRLAVAAHDGMATFAEAGVSGAG